MLFCWGRLHRYQCLLEVTLNPFTLENGGTPGGSSSAEEGCTDTNAYWTSLWIPSLLRMEALLEEALLLRKAAQIPMLTGSHSESLHSWEWRHSWRKLFCWGRLHRYQCLLEVTLNPFTLENGGTPGGSSSAGEGCTDTNAYWKSLLIPSLLRMEALLEEALLLRKAAQTPMLTGSHSESLHSWEWRHSWRKLSAEEGCTDTNAYWKSLWIPSLLRMEALLEEALLLRKAAQIPMLTGSHSESLHSWEWRHSWRKLFCWGRLHRYQCLLEVTLNPFTLENGGTPGGSSSAEEGCTDTNAYWKSLLIPSLLRMEALLEEALLLRKAAQIPMLTGSHSESLHSWEWRRSWRKLFCWGRLHRYQCLLEVTLNPFTLENGGTPGGSSSAEEGCTDTNAYWKSLWIPSLLRMEALLEEALLLRKAAQTPMLTGSHSESLHSWEWRHSWRKLFCWGRLHRYQCLLEVTLNPFTLENGGTPGGSSSAEEGCTDTNAYWKSLWIPSLLRMEALLEEALLLRKAAQTPMLTGSHSESLHSWERSYS